MKIYIRDHKQEFIDELDALVMSAVNAPELSNVKLVEKVVHQCTDIFDVTDEKIDAFVSPANSFGYMDGGIDLLYCQRIGWHLQDELQRQIKATSTFNELLIGEALVIETKNETYPYMISAPTMRMPGLTSTTNVFLAARAAVYAALCRNMEAIIMPGMGTGVGRVAYPDAAFSMYSGIMSARSFYDNRI